MSNRLTIELPDALYERVRQRAETKNQTIEAEVVETVSNAIPDIEGLAPELEAALKNLENLNDKALWKLARTKMSAKEIKKIHNLHYKRQDTNLSQNEEQELAELMQRYNKDILVRAKAAVILKRRGYDISSLVEKEK
jgi:plasmid stability protein